ncbi:unnamed protein product [Rotaria magnacalcarata]|uniref:Uncharacterized protein n=1 Tax=Rotaria magnacalcarata TaxID=392030 RepID=A0A820V2V3_9BILA|nr:unnamed protein product [Rotaria magnacalcarata]
MILGNLPYLKTLIIRDCIIRDHNEMIVTFYSHLSSLTINDCHLSINDIEFLLAQTPSLIITQLDLRHNQVGVLGAEYLAVGLRYNKTLQQLNLALNQLGPRENL